MSPAIKGSMAAATAAADPSRLPLPRHASDAARAVLSRPHSATPAFPDTSDIAAWRSLASQMNSAKTASSEGLLKVLPADVSRADLGDAPAWLARPRTASARDGKLVLALHGGGLVFFGGAANVGADAAAKALITGRPTYGLDYRVPPDHPFPAALNDGVGAYGALLKHRKPRDVVILGDAGGAGLAAALVMRLRDEGLPTPGGLILLTPEVDLTESGDTFASLMGIDPVFTASLLPVSRLYAGQAELTDPLVSPIFGDVRGFPPTLVQSGTRDVLLSSAVTLHRKLRRANVRAELHVWEGMPHGGFGGMTPEDREVAAEVQAFLGAL